MTESGPIERLTIAVRMLAEARDLTDIMRLREMAQVAEQYAKAEKLGDEAVQYAQEIRIRAARKAGQVLREMAEQGERFGHGGNRRSSSTPPILNLGDMGISPAHATRWQKLEAVPEPEFEEKLAAGWGEEAIARGGRYRSRAPNANHGTRSGPVGPKTKTNGFTHKQSLTGLQSVTAQVQALAEALDDGLMGDWTRLHGDDDAQALFQTIETCLPVLTARLRRAIRDWKEQAA